MGLYPSRSDKLDRSLSIKAPHPTRTNERVRYGASLNIKSKSRGRKKFLLQKVSNNGIAHLAGLRDDDEIISINERKLDRNDTVESIVSDIEKGNYILLELKRKMKGKKEPIPFVVFFNLTVEACGEVVIHQFGFYWRTPLNEWKAILNPLIERVITGGVRGDCVQSLPVTQNRDIQLRSIPIASWTRLDNPTRVQISLSGDYLAIEGQRLILSKSASGTSTQFWQYLYSPSSKPVPGEVPVVFVPVDLEDCRIVATGRRLTLGRHDFSSTITDVEQLFFLVAERTSSLFTIRHKGASGTLYWNRSQRVVALTNLDGADLFRIE